MKKEFDLVKIEEATKMLLEAVGENLNRDGIKETPKRVAKAYKELLEGYIIEDESLLDKTFETTYNDGFVTIDNIPVYSFCEHHLLPFFGKALVCYKPNNGKVVGLSKINRLVRNCARRLQTQEQLTDDIAKAMQNALQCKAIKVEVKCRHMCMEMRGVNQFGSETITKVEK